MRKIHINNDDNYATPPDLFAELNEEFNFDFDPCPYFEDGNINFDGLQVSWGKRNFVNPPYSRKLKEAFIRKAFEESKKGKTSVMLLPVSTSTKIFHEIIYHYTTIRFLKGRLRFGKLDSGKFIPSSGGGTKDSMIVIFDGERNKDGSLK